MIEYIWPMLLVILSNVFYHITSKSTPQNANPLISLIVTYLVGAFFSAVLYFTISPAKNIAAEVTKLNWTSVALGITVVGLEVGNIYMYRAGWNISVGSLINNIILAMILVFIGVLFFKEQININKLIGISLCLLGLVMINKK